eukprot:TRINITY_DN456_c0_g1_i1.p1 TRINITY_DN456_c0_g1~~TRINITY_DN456_c0_g1_i1.p1  ORF type:complete len:100 (-),score=2.22 TRINITY_DN456_c0_g1_i1:270-569(-)
MSSAERGEQNDQGRIEQIREWLTEHKLQAVGTVWATGVAGSLLYNLRKSPHLSPSVKLIHARLHAQALTLAALVGAATIEWWEHRSGKKAERYHDSLDI